MEDRFKFRGRRLCKIMRRSPELLAQARLGPVAPCALEKAALGNEGGADAREPTPPLGRPPPRVLRRGRSKLRSDPRGDPARGEHNFDQIHQRIRHPTATRAALASRTISGEEVPLAGAIFLPGCLWPGPFSAGPIAGTDPN